MKRSIRLAYLRTILIVSFIVIASLAFRITFLTLIEFKADEAINLYLASRPFFGHQFPPGSTASSVGVLNPPLILYLLTLILPISKNPMIVTGTIELINSLAIGLFFLVVKKYYGVLIALISSTLVAFSPWHILFSRKIWAQDFLFPFLTLQFFALHKIIKDDKQLYWGLFTFTSMCLIQLHQATIFYVSILSILVCKYINKKAIIYAICGVVLGIIPLLPYVSYQLENDCPDCNALTILSQKTQHESLLAFLESPIQLMGVSGIYKLFGDDYLAFSERFPIAYNLRNVFVIYIALIPLGTYFFFRKEKALRMFVFLIPLLPFIYFLAEVDNQIHYYIPLFPFIAVFAAFGIKGLRNNTKRYLRYSGTLVYLVIITSSIFFMMSFFLFLSERQELKGEYGTTYIKTYGLSEKKFQKYKSDRYYDEMVMLDNIPFHYAFSDVPFSTLYKTSLTPETENSLYKRLSDVPVDPISRNQLIAVYSNEPITKELIRTLRKQMIKNEALSSVFYPIYELHLAKSLQKSVYVQSGNFILEYPRHWNLSNDNESIVLNSDEFDVFISKMQKNFTESNMIEQVSIDSRIATIQSCTTQTKWCGVQSALEVNQQTFYPSLIPKKYFEDNSKITESIAQFKKILLSFEKTN